MKCGIIYKLLSLNTGKFYIGSTYDIERRTKEHFQERNRNSSRLVIEDGNVILLTISFYMHNTEKELREEEGTYIRNAINHYLCVNQKVNGGKYKDGVFFNNSSRIYKRLLPKT